VTRIFHRLERAAIVGVVWSGSLAILAILIREARLWLGGADAGPDAATGWLIFLLLVLGGVLVVGLAVLWWAWLYRGEIEYRQERAWRAIAPRVRVRRRA
jgi:uncharacterized membrane protein